LTGRGDDLPSLLPRDRSTPSSLTPLPRKEQRLVVGQLLFARPQQQFTRQVDVVGTERGQPPRPVLVLRVGQHQLGPTHVARSEREDLAKAGTGRPQGAQQQPVALTGCGRQDGLDRIGPERGRERRTLDGWRGRLPTPRRTG
jgi:hypothetical protein